MTKKRKHTVHAEFRRLPRRPAGPHLFLLAFIGLLIVALSFKLMKVMKEEEPVNYVSVRSVEPRPESVLAPDAIKARTAQDSETRHGASAPGAVRAKSKHAEAWMDEIENQLLAKLPLALQRRADMTFKPGSFGIYKAYLQIDGIEVAQSELSLEQRNGEMNVIGGAFPAIPENLRAFPQTAPNYESTLLHDLEATQNTVDAILFSGKLWKRAENGRIVPCLSYEVDFTDSDGHPRKEIWCVDAGSGAVEMRYSRVRNF